MTKKQQEELDRLLKRNPDAKYGYVEGTKQVLVNYSAKDVHGNLLGFDMRTIIGPRGGLKTEVMR